MAGAANQSWKISRFGSPGSDRIRDTVPQITSERRLSATAETDRDDMATVGLRARAGDKVIRTDDALGNANDLSFIGHRPHHFAAHVRVAGIRRAAATAGLR